MTRYDVGLLGSSSVDGNLDVVHVAIVDGSVVIAPCEETAQRELVLVQQYRNGCGAKRWPSFSVVFGPETRELSKASTSHGSGGEMWSLVSVPLGWAENIARQFIDERDYPGQTISYTPDFDLAKMESDVPRALFIAFQGNEESARQFMARVAALPAAVLDEHIVLVCGRDRVRRHLEEVSGNPEFFGGADPNRVVGYIAEVHFGNVNQPSVGGESLGTLAEAMKKAGLA